jgi:hypothetical protein
MKKFFDNVRHNNQTSETHEEEWEVLRADISYLRSQCINPDDNDETSGAGFFAAEKYRLYKIMHSL